VPWITPVELRTTGVTCFRAVPPADQVSAQDESAIIASGLSFIAGVMARPVGLVAAAWDGQGAADWIVGGPMMLGITSERQVDLCQITLDEEEHLLSWPTAEPHMVVDLQGLGVGEHTVLVSLLESDRRVAESQLAVTVRDVPVHPEGGTLGEGIRLRANPSRPSLDELWRESTTLLIDGPLGADAKLEVRLLSEQNSALMAAPVSRTVKLPMTETVWRQLARGLRQEQRITAAYDEADCCLVTVSKSGVGFARLTAERPFRPLRWRIKKSHGRTPAEVELVDQTDDPSRKIRFYDSTEPLIRKEWPSDRAPIPQNGGLLIAEAGEVRTSIVLPPDLNLVLGKRWGELRHGFIQPGKRSVSRMTELIDGYQLWAAADLPGTVDAEALRDGVLARIDRSLCELVAGQRWARDEAEWAKDGRDGVLDTWRKASILVASSDQIVRQVAQDIGSSLHKWADQAAIEEGFAATAEPLAVRDLPGCRQAARFVFRLAQRPGALFAQAELRPPTNDVRKALGMVLSRPSLYKLARMTVKGARELHDGGSA
jgi:hypothetical protein